MPWHPYYGMGKKMTLLDQVTRLMRSCSDAISQSSPHVLEECWWRMYLAALSPRSPQGIAEGLEHTPQQQCVLSFVMKSSGPFYFGVTLYKGLRELAYLATFPFAVYVSNNKLPDLKKIPCYLTWQICQVFDLILCLTAVTRDWIQKQIGLQPFLSSWTLKKFAKV